MAAYRSALLAGADCIEIDVSRSADGFLFALHDRFVELPTHLDDICFHLLHAYCSNFYSSNYHEKSYISFKLVSQIDKEIWRPKSTREK